MGRVLALDPARAEWFAAARTEDFLVWSNEFIRKIALGQSIWMKEVLLQYTCCKEHSLTDTCFKGDSFKMLDTLKLDKHELPSIEDIQDKL